MDENDSGRKYFKQVEDMQQPQWIADQFVKAASEHVSVRKVIRGIIADTIKNDHEARIEIKAILEEIDKEFTSARWRKFAGVLYTAIIIIVTAIVTAVAENIIRKP